MQSNGHDEIIVNFRNDREYAVRWFAARGGGIGTAIMMMLFGLVGAIRALFFFHSEKPGTGPFFCAVGLLLISLVFLLTIPVAKWRYLRLHAKSPVYGAPESWRITPQRLFCERGDGGSLMRINFAWETVSTVVNDKYGFTFAMKTRTLTNVWLPYNGFGDAGKLDEFMQLARTSGVKIFGKAALKP